MELFEKYVAPVLIAAMFPAIIYAGALAMGYR